MDIKRLNYLISKKLQNKLTEEEHSELEAVLSADNDVNLKTLIEEAWILSGEAPPVSSDASQRMLRGLKKARTVDNHPVISNTIRNNRWYWVAAAASILIIVFFIFQSPKTINNELVALPTNTKLHSVEPGTDGALLILDDGTEIILDSLAPGAIGGKAGAGVLLSGGKLAYTNENTSQSAYHTLKTPRGRQFKIQLPDGSQVWLNAASSIRYPIHFSGAERLVQITGEVYFDIVSNKEMPFVVEKDDLKIHVTGTEFNMNTYEDESSERVTLVEGAVQIVYQNENQSLAPGQQAILQKEKIRIDTEVDLEKVTAWKNGFFSFHNTYLESLMRMLSRWYDVEVVYEGNIPEMKFGGEISRNTELQQVLDILKESKINFRIEMPQQGGRANIIVSP